MYSVDDLKTFVAIAETLSVTAGAKRMAISPATASHRLSKLESALGITLFRRSSRVMSLTEEGHIFFDRTQVILADLAQAEHDAGAGKAELTGTIRITMSPWILSRFILPALPSFQSQHPKLALEFLAVDRFVSLAAEGQDCAIRVGQLADSALVARKLSDNDRLICCAPSFLDRFGAPTNIATALEKPWVCLPWQTRFAFRDASERKREATVSTQIMVSNSDMLTEAAVQGLGLAVKSRLAIKSELSTGQLVEILPGALWEPDAPIWFVFSPEARFGRKAKVFGKLVQSVFK